MTDKQPNQADGGGNDLAADSDTLAKDGPGESGGGAYPNPHTGKKPGGFSGGQTEKPYSGPDNPNATTE